MAESINNMAGIWMLLLLCIAFTAAQTLVNIPGLGSVQGKTSLSFFSHKTIYEFQGIPFAERPARFLPPAKKTPWEGVLNATERGRMCPQEELFNTTDTGDLEDCLFLDIYTPKVGNDSKLPVMFHIHGGAFVVGSSKMASPGFLLERDIVLVVIQYRLGPLGFLSLGIDDIPGNAGMYDQLMALQWVYDNIQYFGGNPQMITVSGVSAGAASASLLYLSPLTEGMINRVLLMSGSALSMIAVGLDPVTSSLRIAKHAGCEDNEKLVPCLQSLEPLALVKAYYAYQAEDRKNGHSAMGGTNPVVDGKFLPKMPLDILRNSSFKGLPMLVSVMKHEGIELEEVLYNGYLVPNNLTEDYATLKYRIPDVLLSFDEMKDTTCTIGSTIKDIYFKPEEFGNYTAMRAGITDFLGAAYFKGPALKLAQLNTLRGGTTFLTTNYWSVGHQQYGVAPHGSDQSLLFPDEDTQYKRLDIEMVRNMTNIFGNFIDGTISSISWEPYSFERGRYLVISGRGMNSNFEKEFTIAEREGLYK